MPFHSNTNSQSNDALSTPVTQRHALSFMIALSCLVSVSALAAEEVEVATEATESPFEKATQPLMQQHEEDVNEEYVNTKQSQMLEHGGSVHESQLSNQEDSLLQIGADAATLSENVSDHSNEHSQNESISDSKTEDVVQTDLLSDDSNKTPAGTTDDVVKEEKSALEKLDEVGESDKKINPDDILPEYQKASDQPEQDDNAGNASQDEKPKESWFKRLKNKYFGDEVGEVERIIAITNIVDAPDLVENVQKAMSEVTVEEFADFRVILPRLRTMSRESASAVGYYDASFVFKKLSPKLLSIEITPNDPVKITNSRIRVEGGGASDEVLNATLSLHRLGKGKVFNSGYYDQLKNTLMLQAQQRGYFESRWLDSEVKVYLPKNEADVDLVLDTGPRYRFGKTHYVDASGQPYYAKSTKAHPSKQIQLDRSVLHKLKPYEPQDEFDQQQVGQHALNLLSTQYFNTVDVKVIKPKVSDADADIRFSDESSAQSTEAALSAQSNSALSIAESEQLDKENRLTVEEQQKTEQEKHIDDLARQAFHTKLVDVQVALNNAKPNHAEVGLGYGTDSAFRVSGKLSRKLLNRHGDKLTANLALSKIQQAVELKYTRPIGNPIDDTLTFFGGYSSEKRDSGVGERDISVNEITAGVQRDVYKYGWHHAFSVKYQADRLETELSDFEIEKLPPQFNDSRDQQALMFGYGVYRTVLHGGLNPYQGYKMQYQGEIASDKLLSDARFFRLRAGLDGLYSFGEDNMHQVLARLDAATLITDEFSKVPYNQRFFAGGDNSIRGYSYKSLSPRINDYLIGGQNLLVGSLEYNRLVYEKWRLAVFTDIGNAYNKDLSSETKYSAGIGARWASPVGPLRIDVAAGLTESSVPVRLHFFIGPPF